MSNVIIGCDNGISGALACISAHNGALIDVIPMPIKKGKVGKKLVNEIDASLIIEWIDEVAGIANVKCVVIEQPVGAKSYKAAVSMAGSFHAIRSALELRCLRVVRVEARTWQKDLLGKVASGDTKKVALEKAENLWPDESFLATARSKVTHSGIVDAALIAEYARRNNL